jgi:hypothetical protein
MLVTLLGIVTVVRPVQYKNALLPMLVTLLPIVTLVTPKLVTYALFAMPVTKYVSAPTVIVAGIVIAVPPP